MIIHQGVYFHSPNDYKSFSSDETLFATLNIGTKFGQLGKPEGNDIELGSKYFFSLPMAHGIRNWVVFGIGETVYTLQPERRGSVRVPYIQFFIASLSEFVSSGILIDPKKLERYCRPYEEVYNEYVNNNKTVKCKPLNETIGVFPEKKPVNLDFYSKERCEKSFAESYDVAVNQYVSKMQELPRVIRWAYSTIITPLDEMYSVNLVTVYPQRGSPTEKQASDNLVEDDVTLREFTLFIQINEAQDAKRFLDEDKLDNIYSAYNQFVQAQYEKKRVAKSTAAQAKPPQYYPTVAVQVSPNKLVITDGNAGTDNKTQAGKAIVPDDQQAAAIVQIENGVAKFVAAGKKQLSTKDAVKWIQTAANETWVNVNAAQSLKEAMESMHYAIKIIDEDIRAAKDNVDSKLIQEVTVKAFITLAECCNQIKSQIEKSRSGFSNADETVLVEFMENNKAMLFFITNEYSGKPDAFDRTNTGLRAIFSALEKAKETQVRQRFQQYDEKYFNLRRLRDFWSSESR